MRQGSALGFLGVTEQAAGCADGQGQLLAAKAFEVLGCELLTEALACRVTVKIPRCATAGATALLGRQALWPVIGDQQLHRVDALKLSQQVLPALDLQHGEVAAGDVQHRQAEQALVTEYGRDQVVAALI
ncbi:hypothetical protein D3C81_1613450 [compost metagenome]